MSLPIGIPCQVNLGSGSSTWIADSDVMVSGQSLTFELQFGDLSLKTGIL